MTRYKRTVRLRPTRVEPTDVDEEFAFHLAMRARELEARGHPATEARQLALEQFGDINEARAVCRAEDDMRVSAHLRTLTISNLAQDVRVSVRALMRQPAFALSTIVTLAVAIGMATVAYTILHAYVVRPLPYPDADRLVYVRSAPTEEPFLNAPTLDKVEWRAAESVFADVVKWDLDGFTIVGGSGAESVQGAWVSPGYLTALGVHPAVGRGFAAEEYVQGSTAILISDALWNRRFGRDRSVIGQPIRLQAIDNPNAATTATVVGILPPDLWHVNRFTDVLRPLPSGNRPFYMAKLAPGMSLAEAERRLNAAVLPQLGELDPAWRMSLAGVQDRYTARLRPTLIALAGGALFLLLIASASVAGAQTARGMTRQAEIAVRVALGASRRRITLQLLTEVVVIAVVSGAIGALLAGVVLSGLGPVVAAQLGAAIPGGNDQLAPDLGFLTLVVSVGTVLGATFGFAPAMLLARRVLSGETRSSLGDHKGVALSSTSSSVRRVLITGQVAVTTMLLVGAGLMGRTVLAIGNTPLGFDDTQVVKGDLLLPPAVYSDSSAQNDVVNRLLQSMAQAAGVRRVAMSFPDPLRIFTLPTTAAIAEGPVTRTDSGPPAFSTIVTSEYFDVLRIPLLDGRRFGAEDDQRAPAVAIVSEGLSQALWPSSSALGRRLRVAGDSVWRTVVGVVGETQQPLETSPSGEVFLPFAQNALPMLFVVGRTEGDVSQAGGALQKAVTRVDADLALANPQALADLTSQASNRHRGLAAVLAVFAALALGLAMLGLHASLVYVVAQRRREIAIRVAVGASTRVIWRLVAMEGATHVVGGLVLGVLLSLGLTRVLATLLYGVAPTDAATFAAIVVLLGAAGLLAALAPLRRASRVAPAEILRVD